MKKSLGIILALVLVLSALFVPLTFNSSAAESIFSGSYTFDFSENKIFDYSNYQDTVNNTYLSETYNGKTYYPIQTYGSGSVATKSTVGYEKINVGGADVDSMKLTSTGSDNNTSAVVLMKDGHPIQLETGKTYTVSYKMYVATSQQWTRVTLGAGALNTLWANDINIANGTWRCAGFRETAVTTTTMLYFPYGFEAFYSTPTVPERTEYKGTYSFTVGLENLQGIYRNDGGEVTAKTVNNFFEITFGARNMEIWLTELSITEKPSTKEDLYVKNGLVSLYSGKNNTGNGYDGDAATWTDLAGDNDISVNVDSNNYFSGGAYHLNNRNVVLPSNILNTVKTGNYTIEMSIGEFNHITSSKGYVYILSSNTDNFALWHFNKASDTSQSSLDLTPQSSKRISKGQKIENISDSVVTITSTYADGVGTVKLYVDGALLGSVAVTAVPNITKVALGCANYSGSYGGIIDYRNLRFYSRALSADEVKYNAELDLNYSEEISYEFGGVSILTDTAAENAGHQAIRVYYGYKLNENGNIDIGYNGYALKERGILVASITTLNSDITIENEGNNVIRKGKTTGFDKCWFFDESTNTVVYSNYFVGFKLEDQRRLKFRGYLILDDGSESGKVVYTDAISTSVVEISGNDLFDPYAYNENYKMLTNWSDSLARLQALDYDFAFGVQTDTHFALGGSDSGAFQHAGKSLAVLTRQEGVKLNYIANLGDILRGYTNPDLDNKFNMVQSAKAITKRYEAGTTVPLMLAVGNHDDNNMWASAQNDSRELITKQEQYSIFGAAVKRTAPSAVFDGNSMYYYIDYPESGIRAIMLDTSDSNYSISNKQLAWFRDVALNTDYSIIIMAHVALIREEGFNDYGITNSANVLSAVETFKANGGEVIGYFYGHMHAQDSRVVNGDNHILFSDGGLVAEVVTIDKATKTIKTVSFGGKLDRTFTYGN